MSFFGWLEKMSGALTTLVAIYGATLSTILAVREYRLAKPHLRVYLGRTSTDPLLGFKHGLDLTPLCLFAEISNRGKVDVLLSNVMLRRKDERESLLPSAPLFVWVEPPASKLPHCIKPGERAVIGVHRDGLLESFEKLGVERAALAFQVEDTLGRKYRSRFLPVDKRQISNPSNPLP